MAASNNSSCFCGCKDSSSHKASTPLTNDRFQHGVDLSRQILFLICIIWLMLPGGSRIFLTWIDAGAGELPAEVDMLPRRRYACLHASSPWVSVCAVSCCRVSVAVRSLLEFESSVSFALLLVAPTIYPFSSRISSCVVL